MTLAVATATFLVLIGMERLWPHPPARLVAVGAGIAAAWFFGLQALGVSTVGLIAQGFPSLTMPDLALIEQLVPGALGIALMSSPKPLQRVARLLVPEILASMRIAS